MFSVHKLRIVAWKVVPKVMACVAIGGGGWLMAQNEFNFPFIRWEPSLRMPRVLSIAHCDDKVIFEDPTLSKLKCVNDVSSLLSKVTKQPIDSDRQFVETSLKSIIKYVRENDGVVHRLSLNDVFKALEITERLMTPNDTSLLEEMLWLDSQINSSQYCENTNICAWKHKFSKVVLCFSSSNIFFYFYF
jgi:hypothetical protein